MVFNMFTQGGKWIAQPYNGHIYAESSTVQIGDILDTNGVLLATTEDGVRTYSDNSDIRHSLLHTIGDSNGYIGTSVQNNMLEHLMGYNPIFGLNDLPFGQNDLKLSIDANINSIAYEGLNGKNGAVLMYNYKTGEIIAKVSAPTFDPSNQPEDLLTNEDYDGVLLDNTVSSSYTPGSVFKTVTSAALMENVPNWEDTTYYCGGHLDVGVDRITCLGTHGDIDVYEAYGRSCNIFFAKAAMDMGADTLEQVSEDLGFNQNLDLGEFTTVKSVIDLEDVAEVNLGWSSVGQYTNTANPMHMLMLVGAIANGGEYVHPTVLEGSNAGQKTRLMSTELSNELSGLMRNAVENYYYDSRFPSGMQIAAKTGTAEVGEGKEPNAWFMGFSQNPETPYAFVVVVEEGGGGIDIALDIAVDMLSLIEN